MEAALPEAYTQIFPEHLLCTGHPTGKRTSWMAPATACLPIRAGDDKSFPSVKLYGDDKTLTVIVSWKREAFGTEVREGHPEVTFD